MDTFSFEELVAEAIDSIPQKYQEKMSHVAILVDDVPSDTQRKMLGLRPCDYLYGLYEGIPLTKRSGTIISVPPDKITIFKHPMIELFPDVKNLRKQIKQTLWHEVGHFFGLNHDMIDAVQKQS
jgi:predicted Zn-dependent protease with MMP-like domain